MWQTKQTFRFVLIALVVLLASTVVAACGGKDEQTGGDGNQLEETKLPKNFKAPLTGEAISLPLTDRPIIVMVENQASARPQSGLHAADIVYEILSEGDITRFVSVYQNERNVAKIGPVRSIRPYFVEIGAGLDGFVVHAGWSPDALKAIKEKKLDRFDHVCGGKMTDCIGDGKYYWRESSRKAPHNLYTSIENIEKGVVAKNLRTTWTDPQLKFTTETDNALVGIPFKSVKVNYYNNYFVSYDYDATSKRLKRGMVGQPHLDLESSQQIAPRNVLICTAKHQVLDAKGRRSVDIYGPGKGYLLQDGRYFDITWENKDGAIRAFSEGNEVGLLPGKTWVQVVPETAKIEWTM